MKNLFKGKKIYCGIDVHKDSWDIAVLTENTKQKNVHFAPGKVEVVHNYLTKNFPGGEYIVGYESGFSGFWAAERFIKFGVEAKVIHAADIPVTDKEKRTKSDKVDALKIAKSLRAGLVEGIYIPEKAAQYARSLIRTRYQFASDKRREKNRIKAHLNFYGIEILNQQGINSSGWSKEMIMVLSNYAIASKDKSLFLLLEAYQQAYQRELNAMRQIREMSRSDEFATKCEWLFSINGVGLLTAMVFLTEIIDIRRFKNVDQLHSFIGLVPGKSQSGTTDKNCSINPRRNKRLKTALILSAWSSIRNDPYMAAHYEDYVKRMGCQKAIIKIARKLVNRIRFVWLNEKKLSN